MGESWPSSRPESWPGPQPVPPPAVPPAASLPVAWPRGAPPAVLPVTWERSAAPAALALTTVQEDESMGKEAKEERLVRSEHHSHSGPGQNREPHHWYLRKAARTRTAENCVGKDNLSSNKDMDVVGMDASC